MKLPGVFSKLLRRKEVKMTPAVDKELVFSLVPVRNPAIKWRRYRSGEVSLMMPVKRRGLIARIDKSEKKKKKIILDKIGSHVWSLCDGEHTFKEILEELMKNYKLYRREAEISLAKYFDILSKKGVISFIPKKVSSFREEGEAEEEAEPVNP